MTSKDTMLAAKTHLIENSHKQPSDFALDLEEHIFLWDHSCPFLTF